MVRIAVDAMGGDFAPREIVHGAVLAAREYGVSIQLVGKPDAIQAELKRHEHNGGLDIGIVPASDVIAMDETAAHRAVAKKKDSSIVVATLQAAEGKADAVVTAGSTGAAAAASRFYLGRIEGVDRAPIAVPMPTTGLPCLLLDGGAFHDANAEQLVQFAVMGSILSQGLWGKQKPRVGILNIGAEPSKGTDSVREAYRLMQANDKLNFVGFIEGRDFPMGKCDVLVSDGFSGNVALKTAEGIAKMIGVMLTQEVYADLRSKVGGFIAKPALDRMKRRIDYNEFGGALLIGLKAVYVKAHGGSRHTAIKNAIRTARDMVNANVVKQTEVTFSALAAGTRI